ncbi:MAG: hypothetical protein RL653_902 [Pseudomonadota bacterium]|jgi:hypothetical protein
MALYEGPRTCAACGAQHILLLFSSERSDRSHSPVHSKVSWKCKTCGEVLLEQEESDGNNYLLVLPEDPVLPKLRAEEAKRAAREANPPRAPWHFLGTHVGAWAALGALLAGLVPLALFPGPAGFAGTALFIVAALVLAAFYG